MLECGSHGERDERDATGKQDEDHDDRPCPWNLPTAEDGNDRSEQIGQHCSDCDRSENRFQIIAQIDNSIASKSDGSNRGQRSQ